jgi:signal transduction histidine kinase
MRSLYVKIFLWFWLAMALVGVAFVVSTVTLQSSEAETRWRAFVASGLTLSGQSAIDVYRARGGEGLADYFERMERQRSIRAYLFDARLRELAGQPVPEGAEELLQQALGSDELAVQDFEGSRLVALRLPPAEGETFVLLADVERPFRGGGRLRDRFDGGRADGGEQPAGGPPGDAVAGDDRAGGEAPPAVTRGDVEPDAPAGRAAGDEGSNRRRGGTRGDAFRRGGPPEPVPWYGVWLAAIDQPGSLALRMGAILLTAGLLCYGLARYLTAPVLRLRDATHRFAGGDLSARVGPTVSHRRDEIAELGRDFDRMAERIETLLTSQRQLLSDVSHELRSPLARLNVALGLARQRSGPEAEAPLDRIEEEAEQLNSLIGRVLALARFESGAVEPELGDVQLDRLVADIAADADFEADPKGTSVRVEAVAPARVTGNEALLRSAIENVVRNAVRYTAAGTDVQVSVTRETGGDGARGPGAAGVVVTVRDHGPGVPDDQLGELFKPFYRLAGARDRQSGGTGLGLAIAERAVRLHGGSVRAANAPGGGLVVEIRLPL